MVENEETTALDAAIDDYERALDLRDAGDDKAALEIIEGALGRIETLLSIEAGIARARFAVTRADLATRTTSVDIAIELAADAVALAEQVKRAEPRVQASAFYMLGKAERPSVAHRHGADSFERSFALWRKLEGETSPYTLEAANALAIAYLKIAQWRRAFDAIELALAHVGEPDPGQLLTRAIACERLGDHAQAAADLTRWLAAAPTRSLDEQVRGHLCAARLAAARDDAPGAHAELALAEELAKQLAAEPVHVAALLEVRAWLFAVATAPPWFLASEVLIRRAAALAWSPVIADTAFRIATLWRYGVEEMFVQPTFAVLDVEATLESWDATTSQYRPRDKHQRVQLVLAGAPTTIERLADDRWRELCVQRVFSIFHAEQFKANEPSFVAPVRSEPVHLAPQQVLELLPSLRVPKWATTNTFTVGSLGEVEVVTRVDFAVLAGRSIGESDARDLVLAAVPSLAPDEARALLAEPAQAMLAPASSIPLIPES